MRLEYSEVVGRTITIEVDDRLVQTEPGRTRVAVEGVIADLLTDAIDTQGWDTINSLQSDCFIVEEED